MLRLQLPESDISFGQTGRTRPKLSEVAEYQIVATTILRMQFIVQYKYLDKRWTTGDGPFKLGA